MSVIEWFDYGLALVLLLYSLWLHRKAQVVIEKSNVIAESGGAFLGESLPKIESALANLTSIEDRVAKNLSRIEGRVEGELLFYRTIVDDLKAKVDEQLEIPISEHMFHAAVNLLVSLGASDMSKESKARQTMALIAFQNIGRHIAMGIKKEIPAVEMLNKSGGGDGIPGGFAPESIIGQLFGIDLPAGSLNALAQGGGGQPVKKAQSSGDRIF